MKFWQKLYLSTLALFLLVFVISIIVLVNSVYNHNLAMEKEKGTREAYWMADRLAMDFDELAEKNLLYDQKIAERFYSTAYYYVDDSTPFALYHNDLTLYLSPDFNDSGLVPKEPSDTAQAKVYWSGNQGYYCVYMSIPEYPEFHFLMLHELVGLNRFLEELSTICLTIVLVGSVLLALLSYFIVRKLTQPLGKLEVATQEIASGQYDTHVETKGKDEFAAIGESFNDMALQIHTHIDSLQKENEKKQVFIDNFAHEMNTPLTSIRGYGEYMLRGMITEEERYEALDFIVRESNRLSQMGKQLLRLADLRQGDFVFTKISVEELTDSLRKLFANRLEEKKVVLTFSKNIDTVYGEVSLLESLAANLIENAIRACEEDGRIEVTFSSAEGGWSLSVRDNGRGIPKEAIPNILEPFYRTDKARSRANGGAGLGMTLVKQIVDLHCGTISVTSEEKKGTEILIFITTS